MKQIITQSFKWRMSGNHGYIEVTLMTTRHLFNTLRMVWNLTIPEDTQLTKLNYSRLGPTYTPEYIKEAMTRLYSELLGRDDVTPAMLQELQPMRDYLARNRGKIQTKTKE
jgi:hypothetical protein